MFKHWTFRGINLIHFQGKEEDREEGEEEGEEDEEKSVEEQAE